VGIEEEVLLSKSKRANNNESVTSINEQPDVEIASVKSEAENLNVRAAIVHMLGDMV